MSSPSGKTGWMTKQGGLIKTWKRRYFVLHGQTLDYFVKPDGKQQGTIDLSKAKTVLPAPECRKKPAFKIVIPGIRTYYIVADTPEEVTQWITAIQAAINSTSLHPTHKISITDFEILRVIGRGTYGKVQLVRNKNDGQLYAMKSMSKRLLEEYDQISQTLTERDILLQTVHPFLVSAHFTFQTDQKIFLVLDYVPGGELFGRLKSEGKFSENRAKLYAAEILLGLGNLHKLGFVYRDLKPENILVDTDGHLKITDFGLAKGKMFDGKTTRTFCGTPEYIAPEMLEQKEYTKSVDWWSFGILLFEMLTGMPPFYDENINRMYRAILNDPVVYPHFVSPSARDLIGKLLERDQEKRLSEMEDVMKQPFFSDIDFQAVLRKEVTPEWIPNIEGETDTSLFAEEFTREEAAVSYEDAKLIGADTQEEFVGFTCVQEGKLRESEN